MMVAPTMGGCGANTAKPAGSDSGDTRPSITESVLPAPVRLNVVIADGHVTPVNATLSAHPDQSIEVHVTSDVADWLVVDSDPAQQFLISVARDEVFGFTPESPGTVTVKLKALGQTVATISSTT